MAGSWINFLKAFYQKQKKGGSGKSYKECMKLAAVEWKKKGSGKAAKAEKGGKLRKKKDQLLEKPTLKRRRKVKK